MERREHQLLLHVKDLHWSYPHQDESLFHHFSLALYTGDFLMLVGKSGSGKSTLVKMLAGMISVPEKTIYHGIADISTYSDHELQQYKRRLGIITQEEHLITWMTVWENVVYPLRIMDLGPELMDMKFYKVAKQLGLEEVAHKKVATLSGGYRQKVAIARALVNNPEFILADEATGNVDWDDTKKVADILIQLNSQEGNTILFVTHDLHLVEYIQYKLPQARVQHLD